MSDKTCCTTGTCCEPTPIDFSKVNAKPVSPAACGTEAVVCCSGGVPVLDGVDPATSACCGRSLPSTASCFFSRDDRGINRGITGAEKRMSSDFLGDTVTYGLSLADIGTGIRTRATAALFKGASLSVWQNYGCSVRPSTTRLSWAFQCRGHGRDRLPGAGSQPRLGAAPDVLQGRRR